MRLFSLVSALAATLLSTSSALPLTSSPLTLADTAYNTNLTDLVTWDNYTLSVLGQRLFVLSGEFHPWRLPVPDLWRDIVEKAKSAGFNTISIYLHWGASNPSDGVLDFDHFRAVQPIIDLCQESGLWLVMRPGPYINAETNAGGIPGWVVAIEGELRTNATDYFDAWQGYMDFVGEITEKNQISNGGPIIAVQIENEYDQTMDGEYAYTRTTYMDQLQESLRRHGVDLPFMHNDASPSGNFAKGPGSVNIYGFDSYPQSFDCTNPEVWRPVPTNWHTKHESINPDQPLWIPEFQGGAFDPWGSSGGYPACNELTGPDFERVFYKALWAANVKLINFYMLYGGTSWGQLAFPGVYTSYDYGCAISENRLLTPKYDELKLQAMFLRSAREFYKTDWLMDDLNAPIDSPIFVTQLRNYDTQSNFYFIRHTNSSSNDFNQFKVTVNTTLGYLKVPQDAGDFTLYGRDHRLIVTDYHFGNTTVLYSTANIFLSTTIDGRDILFVYGDPNQYQSFEVAIMGNTSQPTVQGSLDAQTRLSEDGYTVLNFTTGSSGLSVYEMRDDLIVIAADTDTAIKWWNPTIENAQSAWPQFVQFGTNDTVLISGPYLVRNASINGNTLAIVGDNNDTTPLCVVSPQAITKITFNGVKVDVSRNSWGALEGTLSFETPSSVVIPKLEYWKYMDSLPEVKYSYDDSKWTLANHTTTTNPFPPFNGSGPFILYANDYDYHVGNLLWRGAFESKGDTGVHLGISGGWAFAASVWINEKYAGYVWSRNGSDSPTINETYVFPAGALVDGTNYLTVLQDNMGYYEAGNIDTPGGGQLDIKAPRGIQGYSLVGGSKNEFTSWKVQGNLGGATNFPDRTRGLYNEGGLYGERAGWHLPGFDDSEWEYRSPVDGLDEPGVGFFRTTFDLDIPDEVDVPINVVFGGDIGEGAVRAQIYVNGYQFGKYVKNIGPQKIFPIPRGIINTNGSNTLAISLWGMDKGKVNLSVEDVYLTNDQITYSSLGAPAINNPVWEERDVY